MGMNELTVKMIGFAKELQRFNEKLDASMRQLEHSHSEADPYWQDSMRKKYDLHWLPLEKMIIHYRKVEAPEYERQLLHKIQYWMEYLNDN